MFSNGFGNPGTKGGPTVLISAMIDTRDGHGVAVRLFSETWWFLGDRRTNYL